MVFEILFLVGLVGFVAMALMGALQGHGHHAGDGHGHVGGHGHGHAMDAGHHAVGHHGTVVHHGDAHVGHGHANGHGHSAVGHHDVNIGTKLVQGLPMLLSPMTLFSVSLGMGAVGLLLRNYVPIAMLWVLAALGGIGFSTLIVRPIMNLIMKFVSKPSEGLEGMIAKTAEAASAFDPQGKGLVKMTLDGEVVQLLAILERSERERGVHVARGETVVITEVDAQKGTCIVSRELGG